MQIPHPRNQPYEGRIDGHELVGVIPVKLYFTSIGGRDERRRYEWGPGDQKREDVIWHLYETLKHSPNLLIPHIAVAFPHVTTVYRWGDPRQPKERETNVHLVGRQNTDELSRRFLNPPTYPYEMVCPVESYVIDRERQIRSEASGLDEYLATFTQNGEIPAVRNTNMLREHLERAA